MSRVTTLPAPMTARLPMLTPPGPNSLAQKRRREFFGPRSDRLAMRFNTPEHLKIDKEQRLCCPERVHFHVRNLSGVRDSFS